MTRIKIIKRNGDIKWIGGSSHTSDTDSKINKSVSEITKEDNGLPTNNPPAPIPWKDKGKEPLNPLPHDILFSEDNTMKWGAPPVPDTPIPPYKPTPRPTPNFTPVKPWSDNLGGFNDTSAFADGGYGSNNYNPIYRKVRNIVIPERTWEPQLPYQRRSLRIDKRIYHWLFGFPVQLSSQVLGEHLVQACDTNVVHEIDPDVPETQPNDVRQRYSCISEVVALCKVDLPGITVDTAANRAVAHRFIMTALKMKGVRPSHINEMIWEATEMVFVANKHQLRALELRNTHALIDRRDVANTHMYSRSSPWLLNWFGSRRSVKPPGAG